MALAELLDALDYNQYPQYYLKTDAKHPPDIAPLFRAANEIGVDGIYVFQSSPKEQNILPVRPAVYVAEAQNAEEARKIHRHLWNLGQAPFVIVVLPDHIRVYTGFDYSRRSEEDGVLEPSVEPDIVSIRERLADFRAESINTGSLWQKRAGQLKSDRRVDKRLLKNLNTLGDILITEENLKPEVAHALIGKYIYIRYLRDRKILSDEWLRQHNIDRDHVLGRYATVEGLQTLVSVLESWLNGNIFPLDFNDLTDTYVSQVAAVFMGDQLFSKNLSQLSLDLQIYDFEYIPIETLSSIYEQVLHATGKGKKIGAYYTPEQLADYLLAEMNTVKPLERGMRILDPSCGSGIFLVLAYRRLIEVELAASSNNKLQLAELLELLQYLYGIERVPDACYIAEFSLILTLLHYADPTELFAEDKRFRFPSLHNTQIFQYDFFDDTCPVWKQKLKFDWIVGNPPWIKADSQEEKLAYKWITENQKERPVGKHSISEAFSWRATDLLEPDGSTGFILPATSLYNHGSQKYRQRFFQSYEIIRMTDFSNLRRELFEGRAIEPAVTIIYRKTSEEHEKPLIDHYGPFFINQTPNINGGLWTITINENEFQAISPYEAEDGDAIVWKIALWGTYRDRQAVQRLRRLFPLMLNQLCEKNRWSPPQEGPQLREDEKFTPVPFLEGRNLLDIEKLNKSERILSIPEDAFKVIPKEKCFARRQGGLLVSEAPHILMHASWNYVIYSDQYFVIPPRQIGLSAPQKDADYLRALSIFLSSSVVRYYLFFQTPEWGIERDRITLNDVKSIPVPNFTSEQIEKLTILYNDLVQKDIQGDSAHVQESLDEQMADIFSIPDDINTLATELNRVRLTLRDKTINSTAARRPNQEDLLAYAQQIATELDDFITSNQTHHKVIIGQSPELIVCTVELVDTSHPLPVVVKEQMAENTDLFARLRNELNKEFSQWVYIQRGLKIFEGTKVHIYKMPQLINWTRTQAFNDADDIIATVLSSARDY